MMENKVLFLVEEQESPEALLVLVLVLVLEPAMAAWFWGRQLELWWDEVL